MDNPNSSFRLRRHNSLPSKLQRRTTMAVPSSSFRMKTNPYIGSFRHSPPTSFRSMEALAESLPNRLVATSHPLRRSPYIGWFRHAPPSKLHMQQKVDKRLLLNRFQQLALILEKEGGRSTKGGGKPQSDLLLEMIDGRLRGGGGYDDLYNPSKKAGSSSKIVQSLHQTLQESSVASSSATVKLLARLGSWILFPLAYDAESCGYRNTDLDYKGVGIAVKEEESSVYGSDTSEDECDSDTEGDDDDDDGSSSMSSELDTRRGPLNISLSEIAEAYHAHQVIDRSEYSQFEGDRLDFCITQMDIARMARNASRHLDVDSILNLPTIIYRSPTERQAEKSDTGTKAITSDTDPEGSWSFIMVEGDEDCNDVEKDKSKSTFETTTEKAQHEQNNDDSNMCVICQERFVDGDKLRVLPCNHSFHVGCIDRWLSGSHSHQECFTSGCPTCKKHPNEFLKGRNHDGCVPAWAFTQLGDALARSSSTLGS